MLPVPVATRHFLRSDPDGRKQLLAGHGRGATGHREQHQRARQKRHGLRMAFLDRLEPQSRRQSSSMRSPLFHCRRMVANVCGALPSVKGLPFTATVAPSVHAGIRRCPANSAGFDEETSNCRALSNGISTFLRQPNPRVGDDIHARQRRHPLAERGGGSEPPSVFAEFPRIVGFSRLSSLNPISVACVSRSCLSWRSLVRVTSP